MQITNNNKCSLLYNLQVYQLQENIKRQVLDRQTDIHKFKKELFTFKKNVENPHNFLKRHIWDKIIIYTYNFQQSYGSFHYW